MLCLCFPAAVVALGYQFGYDRLKSDADFSPWPLYVVDGIFWVDAGYSATLVWLSGRWWWLTALVLVPLLCLTGVLAVTCGMWIEGTYF